MSVGAGRGTALQTGAPRLTHLRDAESRPARGNGSRRGDGGGARQAHPLSSLVTVEVDGCGALIHLMAGVPPSVVHFQQSIFESQLLAKESCSRNARL